MRNRTLMEKSLTNGTPWKVILSFMFPVFMGLLLQQFYNTADTIIVGNFSGETSLAAVGACGVLTLVFLAMANGFSAGAYVLIAQLFGAGKEKEMHRQALSYLLVMLGMKNERAASRQLLQPHHNKRVFGS